MNLRRTHGLRRYTGRFLSKTTPRLTRPHRWLTHQIRKRLLRSAAGLRLLFWLDYGIYRPRGPCPEIAWSNAALKRRTEWEDAVGLVSRLGLPPARDLPKTWDSLSALSTILRATTPTDRVLDAGAETYSVILPWLFLYGYRSLHGINIAFDGDFRYGPISYERADLTRTDFPEEYFAAATCLSVVEHGVDLRSYFREMSRILRPGALLVTSTDYFETPIDTGNRMAFGKPVRVFSRQDIMAALRVAREFSFEPTGPIDLEALEKAVYWKQYNLSYTFLVFTLVKAGKMSPGRH